MHNHWFPSNPASALNPCSTSSVGHPPPPPQPPPPQPPDPSISSLPLSVQDFPHLSPLSSPPPLTNYISIEIPLVPSTTNVVMTQTDDVPTPDVVMTQVEVRCIAASNSTVQKPRSETTVEERYTIVSPKATSPLITNLASSSSLQLCSGTQTNSVPLAALPTIDTTIPLLQKPSVQQSTPVPATSHSVPLSLAERIRRSEDKSLHKVSNVIITESTSGRPRVKIPDAVFKKGADLHKEFIVGYFCGRTPAFGSIQSVLNHIWGKGQRLEIHVNSVNRSMLIRIPNNFIRLKVLEKKIWYVGDSMFHVAQWRAPDSSDSDPSHSPHRGKLSKIPLWVHLKELERENGHVDLVEVEYPWIPPTCANCKEIGHIQRNYHKLTPMWVPKGTSTTSQDSSKTTAQRPSKNAAQPNIMSPSPIINHLSSTVADQTTALGQSAENVLRTPVKCGVPALSCVPSLIEELSTVVARPLPDITTMVTDEPSSPESPAGSEVPYILGLPIHLPTFKRPPTKSYTTKPPTSQLSKSKKPPPSPTIKLSANPPSTPLLSPINPFDPLSNPPLPPLSVQSVTTSQITLSNKFSSLDTVLVGSSLSKRAASVNP
ncbi:unnamed protein product [Arabis nemorensis]|uniref:DUF4283 domain-containing protein n=1 Tax=Arabis nemorensis TaxID=586526 RepID=A0A565C5T0_9BRAS|nr:unnamed protein product [Arabis nemorensis]